MGDNNAVSIEFPIQKCEIFSTQKVLKKSFSCRLFKNVQMQVELCEIPLVEDAALSKIPLAGPAARGRPKSIGVTARERYLREA